MELKYNYKVAFISYWRRPTKEEIKFGYGATHFRDFDVNECFNDDGTFKLSFICKDDGLKYYSADYEYFTTKSVRKKIPTTC